MYIIDDWIEDKPCTCNMPLFYAIQLRSTYSWIFIYMSWIFYKKSSNVEVQNEAIGS